jgi:AmiR/NasT family two-component response regulator
MVFETTAYSVPPQGLCASVELSPIGSSIAHPVQWLYLGARGAKVVNHVVEQASAAGPASSVEPATAPRRVLIAEDEALIRLDLREMLIEEGFQVVGEASDGELAVALAKELKPDVVICDVKMPKMDGITAAGLIAGARIAPVVILTAFSQRDLIERARDAGAMAYLIKPFHKRDLLPAIEMATSRFAEIRALEAEVEGLQDRLEARKLIERAKGVLMAEHRLTEPEAFRWIQRAAMDKRTTMRAVAELVLTETGHR